MGLLVLVLILVAPETDVKLALRGKSLRQDPPTMSVQDRFFQGLTGHQFVKSSSGRGSPILDGPESQVQMSAGQGSIQGPTVSFQDLWQELVALREPPVVLQELLDPLLRPVLHTDPNGRPGAAVGVLLEGLQDPIVHMLHIR